MTERTPGSPLPRNAQALIADIRATGAGTRLILDGDVAAGINAARQLPRKRNTTTMTSAKASNRVWTTFSRLAFTKSVVS